MSWGTDYNWIKAANHFLKEDYDPLTTYAPLFMAYMPHGN
jgi:hypothetical protein